MQPDDFQKAIQDSAVLAADEVNAGFIQSVRRLEFRIEETVLQCERFEWIADELRDTVATTSVASQESVLNDPQSRTSSIERALVMLALKGNIETGLLLWHWTPPVSPRRLALLHQIVKIEWENRYRRIFGCEDCDTGAA